MKRAGIYIIFACLFAVFATAVDTSAREGSLAEIWGEIIEKYPPPKPTEEDRQTLASLYASILDKNPYPEKLFEKKDVDLEEIEREASAYVKTTKFSPSNIELCKERLLPYKDLIHKASVQFDVPEKIIGAVILKESSGNPRAKAKTSSAKGLMQTIDDTFAFCKQNLLNLGVEIDNPYDPEDSIMAGTWYLSFVFELARQDFPTYNDRKDPKQWKKALEYYYAGPVWGKNPKPIFNVYVNGGKLTINKGLYSKSVLEYSEIL